jgi:hypothetical protein
LVISPRISFGAEIISSKNIRIDSETEIKKESYYLAGSDIVVDKEMLDDLSVAGGSIIISENINGDLNVIGQNIIINSDISEDIIVIGGSVEISGNINGDIFIFGGKVVIQEESVINGDIIVLGGELDYSGSLTGNLNAITGKVFLNGYIGGDSTITTQKLLLGDFFGLSKKSSIAYFSPEKITEPEELKNQFTYNRTKKWSDSRILQSGLATFFGFWSLFRFITTILLMYLLIYLFKPFSGHVVKFGSDNWARAFLIGIIATIAIPAISIILMVSLIGFPIGLILLTIFSIIFIIRIAVASMIVGGWIRKVNNRLDNRKYSTLFYSIIGLVILSIAKYIPYIGESIFVFVYIIAIGSIINYLYNTIFKRLNK